MIATNNPLNIRHSNAQRWKGQTGQNKGFCTFDTLESGYRAALVLLFNYHKKGYMSIRRIVTRWAPPTENATEHYIEFVSAKTGLTDSEIIVSRLSMCAVCAAMATMETGLRPKVSHLYQIVLKNKLMLTN